MMRNFSRWLAVVAAACVGLWFGWAGRPAPTQDDPASLRADHEAPHSGAERETRLARERSELEIEIAHLGERRDELQALLEEHTPREAPQQPWPSDPGLLEPRVFESAIRESLAHVPSLNLLEIDCDEFPCITVLGLDPSDELAASTEITQPLSEAMRSRGYHAHTEITTVVGAHRIDDLAHQWLGALGFGPGSYVIYYLLPPPASPEASPDLTDRAQQRATQHMSTLRNQTLTGRLPGRRP